MAWPDMPMVGSPSGDLICNGGSRVMSKPSEGMAKNFEGQMV